MEYQDMEEILKDNGWENIVLSIYEKKNRNGYTFQVSYDRDTKEWWCHIDDERLCSCGDVYLPSYSTLELLFMWYGQ